MFNRTIFNKIKDFLWLAGSHDSKAKLARSAFLCLMRPSVRFALIGLVLMALFLGAITDQTVQVFGIVLLLTAPAYGAVLLASGIMLDRNIRGFENGAFILYGLMMTAVLLLHVRRCARGHPLQHGRSADRGDLLRQRPVCPRHLGCHPLHEQRTGVVKRI